MDENNNITEPDDNTTELGGNISLVGFKEVDRAEQVVVKKIVGSYARKISDSFPGFEHLTVFLKMVHKTEEGHGKFEVHAKVLIKGELMVTETVERNLFIALDDVLRKAFELAERQRAS